MTGASTTAFTQDPVSKENEIFHAPSAGGSWPMAKMERYLISTQSVNLPRPGALKTRATMPILGRSQTQRSFSSILDFVKLQKTSDSAINGDTMSRLRQIFWKAMHEYSPLSPVGAMIKSVQSRNISSGVSLALSYGLPREAKVSHAVFYAKPKTNRFT